ncbi:MAG: hypothetical protein JWN18_648 [Parcubacteria group bacterium]|nr:hypothetical protein [Parcubacteria group bacterium]
MPNSRETHQQQDVFMGFEQVLEKFVAQQLPINKIQELTRGQVNIESNSASWVSSARSLEKATQITIGEQKIPENIARQFGWGANSAEQEYAVKVAHEYAHVLQKTFDQHLLQWLDGADDIPEDAIPYLQLYAALATISGLFGLSQLDIYHEQSRATGNLSVPVYEDMAETLSSYLLGDEYFLYRLQHARKQITEDQLKEIAEYVIQIMDTWEEKNLPNR